MLKVDLRLAGEDCQHAVTDEPLCTVTDWALGTDVCHWMFKTKVNMVQGQEDGPLRQEFPQDIVNLEQFHVLRFVTNYKARNKFVSSILLLETEITSKYVILYWSAHSHSSVYTQQLFSMHFSPLYPYPTTAGMHHESTT